MYKQLYGYFEHILSKYQCGFRKGFSTQHCLFLMLEKLKESLDKNESYGALLTDLSKAFDCLPHDLIIAKLNAFGFDSISLKCIYNYLTDRRQRVKVENYYSLYNNISEGVPQGSILGPLLFNIFLCDLFLTINDCDIANYADDTTPYVCRDKIDSVITDLEKTADKLFQWFSDNALKANTSKSHVLLSSMDPNNVNIAGSVIASSTNEKLLGIHIENTLQFDKHVTAICNKVSHKLLALNRVSCYMNEKQKRVIMKAFITSQFGYCPLVWMFHSRKLNNLINRLHERSLRIAYHDDLSSFEELLIKDRSVTIHHRNIQLVAIEIYKVINNISPEIMHEIFQTKDARYNLRSNDNLKSSRARSVKNGTETLRFMGPKIWKIVPKDLKTLSL